jgi:iron-sulfur cluster assembly accessory protein
MSITLTDVAVNKIKEHMIADKVDDGVLRVKVSGGGCSGFIFDLYFDKVREDDIRLEVSGIQIAIDSVSIMYLDGINIDYIETPIAAGFKFSGGEIKSTCGCGSSVSM